MVADLDQLGSFRHINNPAVPRFERYFGRSFPQLPPIIDITDPYNGEEIRTNKSFRRQVARFLKGMEGKFQSPDQYLSYALGIYSTFYDRIFVSIGSDHPLRAATENHETAHALNLRMDPVGSGFIRQVDLRMLRAERIPAGKVQVYNQLFGFSEGVAYWLEKDFTCLEQGSTDHRDRAEARRKLLEEDTGGMEFWDSYRQVDVAVQRLVSDGLDEPSAILDVMRNPVRSGIELSDRELVARYLTAA